MAVQGPFLLAVRGDQLWEVDPWGPLLGLMEAELGVGWFRRNGALSRQRGLWLASTLPGTGCDSSGPRLCSGQLSVRGGASPHSQRPVGASPRRASHCS